MALTEVRFQELNPALSRETLRVLGQQGFVYATPVQAQAIPRLCLSKDAVVGAATGSGKTLAFLVPMLEILRPLSLRPHQVGALIVSPTRELAWQTFRVGEPFFKSVNGLGSMLLVGGADVSFDIEKLQSSRANVLIGTPGRLYDILQHCSHLDFSHFKMLILDEADRLLEMGFHHHVSEIIKCLPKDRITGLFSATQTHAVRELAKAGVREDTLIYEVTTQVSKTPATLNVEYVIMEGDEKSSQLAHFLLENVSKKVIVYFITCASVDYWGTVLPRISLLKDVRIIALHGKLKQRARVKALEKFTSMPNGVLLCTDVAARGLDIPGVDLVVQYDAPQDPNMFVHRVGRTARLGRSGDSLIFLLPKEDAYVEFLRIRSIPTKERQKPDIKTDIIPMLRAVSMRDRDVMQKAIKAFVSCFRAYKEHHCNYIFQWKQLELGKVAMAFGLLQLPSMPELKKGVIKSEHFVPVQGINVTTIKYRDKRREKQRKEKLESAKLAKRLVSAKQTKCLTRTDGRRKRSKGDDDEINEDYRLLKREKKARRMGKL